jgi:hypothetical protein
MASPRARRGREMTGLAPLQFDRTDRHEPDYQAEIRERAARSASNYPAGTPARRTRTASGYPVQVRNDLPVKLYRYRGQGHDLLEAELGPGYWQTTEDR